MNDTLQITLTDKGISHAEDANILAPQSLGEVTIVPLRATLEASRLSAVGESETVLREHFLWCKPPYDEVQNRSYLQLVENLWRERMEFHFAVLHRYNNRYLGEIAIDLIDNGRSCINIMYWIRQSEQNNGYATASTKLLLQVTPQLVAVTFAEFRVEVGNTNSKRVVEKTGARFVEMRSAPTVNGSLAEYYCFHYPFD